MATTTPWATMHTLCGTPRHLHPLTSCSGPPILVLHTTPHQHEYQGVQGTTILYLLIFILLYLVGSLVFDLQFSMVAQEHRRASESMAWPQQRQQFPTRLAYTRTTSEVKVCQVQQATSAQYSRRVSLSQEQEASQAVMSQHPTQQVLAIRDAKVAKQARYAPARRSPSPHIRRSVSPKLSSGRTSPAPLQLDTFIAQFDLAPVEAYLTSFVPSGGRRAQSAYRKASFHPPITAASLSELEACCILNNPKLRHDINFDRELHFRPNLDGDRGKVKIQAADDYWTALEVELEIYAYMSASTFGMHVIASSAWYRTFSKSQRRLPAMFKAAKDIIFSMNEKSDMPGLNEAMDVDLMMQQIQRGVFNLIALANFLQQLLKAHCAPMRDSWVDRVCDMLRKGWQAGDLKAVVIGFKEFYALLEAMKLDIANHQIRHLRPVLLDSTVAFEQAYYKTRLHDNSVDVRAAREWYTTGKTVSAPFTTSTQSLPLKNFLVRFLESLIRPATSKFTPCLPETFKLDHDRLIILRADIHSTVYTSICIQSLTSLMQMLRRPAAHQQRATKYMTETLPILLGRGTEAKWVAAAGNIAVEVVRAAVGDFQGEERAPVLPNKPTHGVNPDNLTTNIEAYLQRCFKQDSQQFDDAVSKQLTIVTDRVNDLAQKHRNLSARDLVEVFVPQPTFTWVMDNNKRVKKHDAKFTAPPASQDLLEDAAKRCAHISILHWRVWADLVYLAEEEEESDEEMSDEEEL